MTAAEGASAADASSDAPPRRIRLSTLVVLGLMGAFGPLAMDVYIAALPQLGAELHASDAAVQATVSTCLLGLAGGQLIAGPVSDRIGRRPTLLIGTALFLVASMLCAIAPDIWTLIACRVLQGVAGATGIAVSRAAIRDHFEGSEVARVLAQLTVITGVAPIAAPLIGGGLTLVTDWRGIFVVLGVIGGVLFLAVLIWVPESLKPEHRLSHGFGAVFRQFGVLFRDPLFLRFALVGAAAGGAFFSYISMTSIVLQGEYRVSPVVFSLLFGINAAALIAGAQVNALLIPRVGVRRLLAAVLGLAVLAAGLVVVFAGLGLPLAVVQTTVGIALVANGMQSPNSTALALAHYAKGAGTASAMQGGLSFVVGAIVPPIVAGVFGTSAVSMGATMGVCSLVALVLSLGRDSLSRRPVAAGPAAR